MREPLVPLRPAFEEFCESLGAQGLPLRAKHALQRTHWYRADVDEQWVRNAGDEDLMQIDDLGRRGISELRKLIPKASPTKHVLTYGECDAEVLGVFDAQEDARHAAEAREGSALAWLDGWRSQDYRVIEVPYVTHAQATEALWAKLRKDAGI